MSRGPSPSFASANLTPSFSSSSTASNATLMANPSHANLQVDTRFRSTSPSGYNYVTSPDSVQSKSQQKSSTTVQIIGQALEKSEDKGETLDMSRQAVGSIGEDAVEMFRRGVGKDKKGVWRLALSYNSLKDNSISPSFGRLRNLRYLNLKGNEFTHFPPALCELTCLDILDLSKNLISSFPDIPKHLCNLRILSLSNNRIYTLPSYLTTFNNLKVLKIDQNPIEWPPREVLGALMTTTKNRSRGTSDAGSISTSGGERHRKEEDVRPWIENMKSWMRQKAAEGELLLERSRLEDDSFMASEWVPSLAWLSLLTFRREEPSSAISTEPPNQSWSRPTSGSTVKAQSVRDEAANRPLSPAFKRPQFSRNPSAAFSMESLRAPSPSYYPASHHERTTSTASSTNTPPVSASTASSSSHSRLPSVNVSQPTSSSHSRGASYTTTQRISANVLAKKSLPDLRQSHARIISDRRNDGKTEEIRPLGLGIAAPGVKSFQLKSMWGDEMDKMPSMDSRILARKGSSDMLRKGGLAEKRNSQEDPLIDESRNSYFRRLSTLPVSSISKAIPLALLKFIDSIRGILFSLSQLHTALRQYLVFAVNERVAGVFARVMEPAGNYMMNLINALDRFDSMSRRSSPPIHAIRAVVDAAKESVAVFAKIVAVIQLQVSSMKGNDVRYTRTLIVMIYGSMAEIACSWQAMAPLLAEIKSLLVPDQVAARAIMMGGHKMVSTGSLTGRTPISPIPEKGETHSPPIMARTTVPFAGSPLTEVVEPAPAPTVSARGKARRQGGSFSTQDVEQGMLMGSPGGPRSAELVEGTIRHRPSTSATIVLEQTHESEGEEEELAPPAPQKSTSAVFINPITPPTFSVPHPGPYSRQGHRPSSSSGSSHALSSGLPAMRKLSVDVRPPTPASATLFDEDLLDVIETATDIAFTVWLKLAEDLGASSPPFSGSHTKTSSQSSTSSMAPPPFTPIGQGRPPTISPKAHGDLLILLSVSEQITAGLKESTMGLRANPHSLHTTTLSDDAQAFIKTVIKVSEMVKAISATHSFPNPVRQCLSRLTQATRECAILIQVSSLRPGNATPAPIPPASARSHYSRSSRGSNGGPESSTEDLGITPSSAGYQGWSNHAQPMREGLRGLQLPNRQALLGRSRSANVVEVGRADALGEGYQVAPLSARSAPRSAQPSQTAF
ncbi:hypothetical protein P7C73_g5616, partial [Tremellales sp. Uapishka_1]